LTVDGLPLIKPPYSTISAIHLDKGEIVWQTPHGETPDAVRQSSRVEGLTFRVPDNRATTSVPW